MLDQETAMVTGFLVSKQGVAGWAYFQTDPMHWILALQTKVVMRSDRLCKMGTSSSSAALQLLSAVQGRERLSHRVSSSWALLATRCLPRCR